MADELKDQRVPIMMSPSELTALDDWMFANRIRSRGEAIRRLVQMGLVASSRLPAMQKRALRRSQFGTQVVDILERPSSEEEQKKAFAAARAAFARMSVEDMEALMELSAHLTTLALGRDVEVAMEQLRNLQSEIDKLKGQPHGAKIDAALREHFSELFGESFGPAWDRTGKNRGEPKPDDSSTEK